jgi:hypothetical protein
MSDPDIPRRHCVITMSDGTVIYTGRTTGPGDRFLGGIGDSIIVNPDDYEGLMADLKAAEVGVK